MVNSLKADVSSVSPCQSEDEGSKRQPLVSTQRRILLAGEVRVQLRTVRKENSLSLRR